MGERICAKCKETKDESLFYKRSNRPGGLHYRCSDCMKKEHAEWRKTNKENNRQRAARFRERHKEKVRANHREWQKKNAGYLNALNATRHAKKLQATPRWIDKAAFIAIYNEAKEQGKVVDHIVPLQSKLVCGLHVPWNLQLLTDSENAKKKNYYWPDMP